MMLARGNIGHFATSKSQRENKPRKTFFDNVLNELTQNLAKMPWSFYALKVGVFSW